MAMPDLKIGETDEWYTPSFIFDALGIWFDLDPCSPGASHYVPAANIMTKEHDGLKRDWFGTVWMNPPFGGRNGHIPWLKKFIEHGDGVACVRAYTSAGWFHDWAIKAETMIFPRGKTKFIRPDGTEGKSPGHGIVLLGMGYECNQALENSGLGMFCRPQK